MPIEDGKEGLEFVRRYATHADLARLRSQLLSQTKIASLQDSMDTCLKATYSVVFKKVEPEQLESTFKILGMKSKTITKNVEQVAMYVVLLYGMVQERMKEERRPNRVRAIRKKDKPQIDESGELPTDEKGNHIREENTNSEQQTSVSQ